MENDAKQIANASIAGNPHTNAVEESAALLNLPPPVWTFLRETHEQFADALLAAHHDTEYPFVNVDILPAHTKSFLRKLVRSHAPLAELLRDSQFAALRQQAQQIFRAQLGLEVKALLNALRALYEARQLARTTKAGKARKSNVPPNSIAAVA